MSDSKLKKYLRTIPKVFKPGSNPVLNALLQGFAGADDEISTQIQNTKAQLFVRTAEGQNLDKLANSLGVSRPVSLGLTDAEYQNLIPNLSLKAKQIRKTFYDTAEVFWGPLFIYTNAQTANYGPFNVSLGDSFEISIDNKDPEKVKVLAGDIAINGAATAQEIVNILSRIDGITVTIQTDALTGDEAVNIRTNTPGAAGALQIYASSMVGASKLDFKIKKYEIIQQPQRVVIYEIRPNEVLIEIPAIVPALRRTLKGSHHLHADATLEGPVAPGNGIWQGSFLYDSSGTQQTYTVSRQKAETEEALTKGNVYTKVTVDDTVNITSSSGFLIFGWGLDSEEQPVKFRGVPNSKTVLLDPSYVFKKNQPIGTPINVIADQKPYKPRRDGTDLAIYLTSPSDAREVVQKIIASLAAAGVIVNFVVLAPDYIYHIDNPYLSTDDAV
jgi:hypothetical protein